MRRFWRENSLTLVFISLFLVTAMGEAAAGYFSFNQQQVAHGQSTYTFTRYLVSSQFAEELSENWQSEFLQFASFIILGVWFRQKGSTQSKELAESWLETDREQQVGAYARQNSPAWARVSGWRRTLFSNSLVMLMAFLFFASWAAQMLTGWSIYNDEQRVHHQPPVSLAGYAGSPDFWEHTLQNWQSEFLAVASITIFSVFLRQRGSPQSKPVGSPHEETGVSG